MRNDKIIERFEKDFESMQNFWGDNHNLHRKDMKFTWHSEQWDGDALQERGKATSNSGQPIPPRPTNVFNIQKPFIVKVVNGVKKLKPSIKVLPVDRGTDKKLTNVRRGVHKAIERNTGAVPSRLNATKDAITAGYGFYRFVTDYCNPKSFEQDLVYKAIEDATTVLWDENSRELDGSDVKKCIIQERTTEEEFENDYGMKWEDVYMAGGIEMQTAWGTQTAPVVSEYWFIEEKPERLVSITDEKGQTRELFLSEAKKEFGNEELPVEAFLDTDNDGEIIERPTTSRQVWWVKLAGKKVLDKVKWKGYWIPVFKVEGRKAVIDGKVSYTGLSRDSQGSQKAYNYARNGQLERMGMTTKNSHYVPVGGIPTHVKYKWDSANTRNWSTLEYNAYDSQGRNLPPPQRTSPVPVDVGLTNEAMNSAEEIKASMGLFGDYIGNPGANKSGKAILAGAQESADIVFDFSYNMAKTMEHEGRVREELLPKIYDTPRQIRMVGEDETEEIIWVNKNYRDETGKDQYHDLKTGKFDIAVVMGKSDETKRIETRESMEVYMKTMPNIAPLMADYYAREQDWQYSDEIAERAKRFIRSQYPGVIADGDENPEMKMMQQKMQQMQQQAMQALQQLKKENEQLKTDKKIEMAKIQTDAQLEKMKIDNQDKIADEKNELDIYKAENNAEVDKYNAKTQRLRVQTESQRDRGKQLLEFAKHKTDISKQKEGTPRPTTREQPME